MRGIIMVGLSGSGKSTMADRLNEKGHYVIVSKDTIRLENPHANERRVSEIQTEILIKLAGEGKDVIVDNTHMFTPSYNKINSQLKGLGYEIRVYDMAGMFATSQEYLEKSLDRNSKRVGYKRVPDSVIHQMYLQTYKADKPIVIVDVDGTLAKMSDRIKYIQQEPKNHDEFYARVLEDLPHQPVIDVVNLLADTHTIVIVSGRRNGSCADTITWLNKYGVKYDHILMRNANDRRPDRMVKKEIYERCLKGNEIKMVFDDRKQVVDYRKSIGLYVFNCCQEESNDF